MHSPSIPEDLDPLDRVWAGAVLQYLFGGLSGVSFEDGGVSHPYAGDRWWHIRRFPDDRAVLWGRDVDHSMDHRLDDPVDFLAGAPEWLPLERLQSEIDDEMVGYLYWWERGAWHRAPYPEDLIDDGLISWVGEGAEGVCGELYSRFDVYSWTRTDELYTAVDAYLERAAAGTVDEAVVRRLVTAARTHQGDFDIDVPHAMDVVRRAGLGR